MAIRRNNFKKAIAALLLCAGFSINTHAEDKYVGPTDPLVQKNLAEWQDMKFGMFIHWGFYSVKGIVESWSIHPGPADWVWADRPKDVPYFEYLKQYEDLQRVFNPVKFNPDEWAAAAKYAGMKYLVFTTKHHDGFCMFDTKQTDYKVTSPKCPFSSNPRANIVKEVFNAYRAAGLKIGAYYSIADWHCQDYWWDFFPPRSNFMNYDPKQFPEKWQKFQDFVVNQIDELTNGDYGDISLLWFDQALPSEEYNAKAPWERIAKTARAHQPGMMMVARDEENEYEDYLTPENRIPDEDLGHPWESCMTMSNTWSWSYNANYKPTRELLTMLVKVVSRGGNLLLNVGPSGQGTIDEEALKRLHEMGDWMQVNSEGIYRSKPFKMGGNLYGTTVDGNVYAYYVPDAKEAEELPAQITVPGVKSTRACLLGAEKTRLKCTATSDGVTVTIPEKLRRNPPCSHIWCVKFSK